MEDREVLDALSKTIVGSEGMVRAYGLSEVSRTDDTLVLRSLKCGMTQMYRMAGVDTSMVSDETICNFHHWYYWGITQRSHPRLVMQFTKRIIDGDDCCEWTYKILNAEKLLSEPSR